ncbi:MAG: DMT family transporter [Acidobacteriota bacterium]
MGSKKTAWIPFLSLLLAMMLWASSFVALKIAFRTYDPMFVIFGRMAVASVCFLLFLRAFRGNVYRKGDLKVILFMGFCEPCLYFIFEAKAIQNTTASQAGMVTAMLPLMVAVAARIFLKERITARTISGFGLAIAGTSWLSVCGEPCESAPFPMLGNFLEFMAMVCATGYIVTLKHLSERYSPFFLTAIQAFMGSLFFLPFLFLSSTTIPDSFEPVPSLSILYLGVFITLGAYGLYNFGVSRLPAGQASSFINLIPVFTVIFGWIILDERFTPMQYVASALVLAGVFISQDRKKVPRVSEERCCAATISG